MPENQSQRNDERRADPDRKAKARPAPEETRSFDQDGEDETDLGEGEVGTSYEPSTVQVNRARMQGDGVGQKDLDRQRDPTGDKSYEEY